MGIITRTYIGSCENEKCSQKGEIVKFPVRYERLETFWHEPPTCSWCGKWLFGDIMETEEGKNYR